MPILKARPPKYCPYRHGARVSIQGHTHYLPGKFNSDESLAEYRRLIAEWAAGMTIDVEIPDADADATVTVTVAELLADYLEHAKRFYGEDPKSRYEHMRRVVRTVRETYADLSADQFSPKKLKVVRQVFISRGNCRRQVNDYTRDVIAIFSWGAEQEMIPGSVVHALREVRSLQRGRTEAPEGKTVHAVEQSVVGATLPELVPVLADMVRLQLVSGCRPGEVCSLSPGQIDRSTDVWLYRLAQHKNTHRGHDRVVALGPKAQDILRKYLLRPADSPCFSPKEALFEYFELTHERRVTPESQGNKPKPGGRKRAIRKVGDLYDVPAYRKAIGRACDRAFPAPEEVTGDAKRKWQREHRWNPHQLRHSAGTNVREVFGLDGSQAILGNRHARTAEIYSELNTAKAVEIARKLG